MGDTNCAGVEEEEGASSGKELSLTAAEAAEQIKKLRKEVFTIKQELREKTEDVHTLQNDLQTFESQNISLSDARRLTHMALKKGRALMCIEGLMRKSHTNVLLVRECFRQLTLNCFGWKHLSTKRNEAILLSSTGITSNKSEVTFSSGCVKLLRAEQLILLAENEKLDRAVKQLKNDLVNFQENPGCSNNNDNAIQHHSIDEKKPFSSLTKHNSVNKKEENNSNDDVDYVEIDIQVANAVLRNLVTIINVSMMKQKAFAIRVLAGRLHYNNIHNRKCKRLSSRADTVKQFADVMAMHINHVLKITLLRSFMLIYCHSKIGNVKEELTLFGPGGYRNHKDVIKQFQTGATLLHEQRYTPPYYTRLPSMQTRRSTADTPMLGRIPGTLFPTDTENSKMYNIPNNNSSPAVNFLR